MIDKVVQNLILHILVDKCSIFDHLSYIKIMNQGYLNGPNFFFPVFGQKTIISQNIKFFNGRFK